MLFELFGRDHHWIYNFLTVLKWEKIWNYGKLHLVAGCWESLLYREQKTKNIVINIVCPGEKQITQIKTRPQKSWLDDLSYYIFSG